MRTAAVLLAFTVATPADAFITQNGLIAQPHGPGDFTVPYRGKSALTDFWCAAGDYVIRGLNQPPSTRIWRLSPPPRRSGEGIRFSLSPKGAAGSTGIVTLLGAYDGSFSAAKAQSFCEFRNKRRR